MASVTNSEIKKEFEMFGDIFKFFKAYYHPETGADKEVEEKYWADVANDLVVIEGRYDTQLCKDLLYAVFRELTRREDIILENIESDYVPRR